MIHFPPLLPITINLDEDDWIINTFVYSKYQG